MIFYGNNVDRSGVKMWIHVLIFLVTTNFSYLPYPIIGYRHSTRMIMWDIQVLSLVNIFVISWLSVESYLLSSCVIWNVSILLLLCLRMSNSLLKNINSRISINTCTHTIIPSQRPKTKLFTFLFFSLTHFDLQKTFKVNWLFLDPMQHKSSHYFRKNKFI